MRPFSTRAPDMSSGDRIKDLKAKNIYKASKMNYQHGINGCKSDIRFTSQGSLKSTTSNELRQLVSRGYALCEDGLCCANSLACDISNTGIPKRGLLNCSKSVMAQAIKIDTQNNLFSHFVKQYLPPGQQPNGPFSMIASYDVSFCDISLNYGEISGNPCSADHWLGGGIIMDPSGLYLSACAESGNNAVIGANLRKNHLWSSTAIQGENDISGVYTVCQGGSGVNLSWGNNTKQNYLTAYDPRRSTRFCFDPKKKDISNCII